MSAEAQMAGLYPPLNVKVLKDGNLNRIGNPPGLLDKSQNSQNSNAQ